MKKNLLILSVCILVAAFSLTMESCRRHETPPKTTPRAFEQPQGFPEPHYKFDEAGNPLTDEGFELGRKLFYDGRLSKDGNFPCASCHQQFAAFATFDHNLSHGFNNSFTMRNAPGLFNLAWHPALHHDGGINNLEVQPLAPLTAPNEMAETIDNVVNKLRQDAMYRDMFTAAFGSDEINSQRMLKALAQFMGSIVSADSKYDRVMRGEAQFNSFEQRGYALFQANCASCHQEPLFTDFSFRNTGLAIDPWLNDKGRMRITGDPADSLKFKVPSLRNVFVTFPYMHDGRFYSLHQCVNHYRTGVQQGPTLDPSLQNGISLTNAQVSDIVEFLKSLTDSTFIKDVRFSQP